MSLNNSENGVIYNRFFDAVSRAGGLVALVATADEIGIFLSPQRDTLRTIGLPQSAQ